MLCLCCVCAGFVLGLCFFMCRACPLRGRSRSMFRYRSSPSGTASPHSRQLTHKRCALDRAADRAAGRSWHRRPNFPSEKSLPSGRDLHLACQFDKRHAPKWQDDASAQKPPPTVSPAVPGRAQDADELSARWHGVLARFPLPYCGCAEYHVYTLLHICCLNCCKH